MKNLTLLVKFGYKHSIDSMEVANLLKKAGVKGTTKLGVFVNYDGMRKAISDPGFESQDHGGLEKANTYVEKSTGKVFTQKEFVDFL